MGRRLTDADIEGLLDPSNPRIDRPALSAFVAELRRQYATTPHLPPGNELSQVMRPTEDAGWAAHLAPDPRLRSSRTKKVLAGLTTVVATTAGKVMLGTALAASAVGGAHATDLVDLPALPDQRPTGTVVSPDEPPAGGDGGSSTVPAPGAGAGDTVPDGDGGPDGADTSRCDETGGDRSGAEVDGDAELTCPEPGRHRDGRKHDEASSADADNEQRDGSQDNHGDDDDGRKDRDGDKSDSRKSGRGDGSSDDRKRKRDGPR